MERDKHGLSIHLTVLVAELQGRCKHFADIDRKKQDTCNNQLG